MNDGARVQQSTEGGRLVVRTEAYTAVIRQFDDGFERSPYLDVHDPSGRRWCSVNLMTSVHAAEGADETLELGAPRLVASHDDEVVRLRLEATSSYWRSRVVVVDLRPGAIELTVSVEGDGRLTDVTLLGGDGVFPGRAGGRFRSRIDAASLFVPAPGEPIAFVRGTGSSAVLGVVGDAGPGRLNALFSPPPMVLGLGHPEPTETTYTDEGSWLGASLRAPVEELTCTAMRYDAVDGGALLTLPYEGQTRVSGDWSAPTLVLRPASSAIAVVDDHRADLVAHGMAPDDQGRPDAPAWWSAPIFCGWGAQCAAAIAEARRRDPGFSPERSEGIDPWFRPSADVTPPDARLGSRQDVYDRLLDRLDMHGIAPGTIVVDDRWQSSYGLATPDLDRWPDLRAWIDGQHARGRRVLLWWKAWDPEGVPPDECVRDGLGRSISVDPGSAAYRDRLRRVVGELVGPSGLGADGLKVDFTQAGPSGTSLVHSGTTWGIAALHELLAALYDAAKAANPDALVITHAMHPSFGDVSDMIRLNDVSRRDVSGRLVPVVEQMTVRHAIATRALPGRPVDTDQWPMPTKADWAAYVRLQPELGVPALYYTDSIERTGEPIDGADLEMVAEAWRTGGTEHRA